MSGTYYKGIPEENVDFKEEFEEELENLLLNVSNVLGKKNIRGDSFNYRYWALKLSSANKVLEEGKVTLS